MTEPSGAISKQELRLVDLIPNRWFKSREDSSIWLAGFRIPLIDQAAFLDGPSSIDLDDSLAVLAFGEVNYFDPGTLVREEVLGGTMRMKAVVGGKRTAGPSPWLLILTPFRADGVDGSEGEIRQRISSAAAMIAVFCGRNAVFERVFDNVVSAAGESIGASTAPLENPGVFPVPDLERSRLDLLARAARALSASTEAERNRIRLSLHWYESALRVTGVDTFLKAWIALEVLAMPDDTNIRPINESLARTYKQTLSAATARFHVGRLLGMRSRIVHGGELVRIHYLVELYLQAIYSDVLCDTLLVPTQADAETLLDVRGTELLPLLIAEPGVRS